MGYHGVQWGTLLRREVHRGVQWGMLLQGPLQVCVHHAECTVVSSNVVGKLSWTDPLQMNSDPHSQV